MGTFMDHTYFCKGDKALVEKARKAIERFQKKNAKYSGNTPGQGNCRQPIARGVVSHGPFAGFS